MLYLLAPNGQAAWNDMPGNILHRPPAGAGDLADLPWLPADVPDDETTVALALRYGAGCRTGIVLDAWYVIMPPDKREEALSAAEPDPELVELWAALGGMTPEV